MSDQKTSKKNVHPISASTESGGQKHFSVSCVTDEANQTELKKPKDKSVGSRNHLVLDLERLCDEIDRQVSLILES